MVLQNVSIITISHFLVTWSLHTSSCLYTFLMNGFKDAFQPLWLYIIFYGDYFL